MAESKRLENSIYSQAEASPGLLFWRAFHRWQKLVRAELEKLELTQAQYSILAAVSYLRSEDKLVSQQQVAEQLSMDKMMVSDVVKTLRGKKLLGRKAHPEDGRAYTLHLTPEANRLLQKAVPAVESTDEAFFQKISSEERRRLIEILKSLDQA